MEYYAAVTMIRQMVERGMIDEDDYRELEAVYAGKYKPKYRYTSPGKLSVEPEK